MGSADTSVTTTSGDTGIIFTKISTIEATRIHYVRGVQFIKGTSSGQINNITYVVNLVGKDNITHSDTNLMKISRPT